MTITGVNVIVSYKHSVQLFCTTPIEFDSPMTEVGLFEKLCSGAVAGVIGTAV
jgi:hypothetical protein